MASTFKANDTLKTISIFNYVNIEVVFLSSVCYQFKPVRERSVWFRPVRERGQLVSACHLVLGYRRILAYQQLEKYRPPQPKDIKVDDGKRIGRVKLQGARQLGTSIPRWHSSCQRIGRYEVKCEGVGRGAVIDGIVPEIEEFFADTEMLSYSDFRSFVLGTPEHTDSGSFIYKHFL
ncbi:hypothetical protein Tco_0489528 [Tanacetum coccineum]